MATDQGEPAGTLPAAEHRVAEIFIDVWRLLSLSEQARLMEKHGGPLDAIILELRAAYAAGQAANGKALDAYEAVTADIVRERDEARAAAAEAQKELIFYRDAAKHWQAAASSPPSIRGGPMTTTTKIMGRFGRTGHGD